MKTPLIASLLIPALAFITGVRPAMAEIKPGAEKAAEAENAPEAGFAPKEYSLSRYDHLNKKSPFEFDPQKPVENTAADPFEGVSLAGYVGSGQTMTVYLLTGKEKKRETVYGDGSPYKKRDKSGFRVVGIKRGKTLKTTAVIMEKDGQQKEIMFEEDALRPKGGAPGPGVQMVPGPNGTMVPRPVIPRPGGGGAPQNTGGYQAPQAFVPGQTPNPQQQNVNQGMVNVNNGLPQGVSQNPPPVVPGQQNQAAQQQINSILGNPNVAQPAQTAVPQQPGGPNSRGNGPPTRRRVVLPTQ